MAVPRVSGGNAAELPLFGHVGHVGQRTSILLLEKGGVKDDVGNLHEHVSHVSDVSGGAQERTKGGRRKTMRTMTLDDVRHTVENAARRVQALLDEGKHSEAAALARRVIAAVAPLTPVAWASWRVLELAVAMDG